MKVVDLLESRRTEWRELEQLCARMEGRWRRKVSAETALRFSALYRAACADLALADAYQFPPAAIDYSAPTGWPGAQPIVSQPDVQLSHVVPRVVRSRAAAAAGRPLSVVGGGGVLGHLFAGRGDGLLHARLLRTGVGQGTDDAAGGELCVARAPGTGRRRRGGQRHGRASTCSTTSASGCDVSPSACCWASAGCT